MTETIAVPVPESLSGQLRFLHQRLEQVAPAVERIAVVLYDPGDRTLKSFINSTRHGYAIRGYEYPLARSESLSSMAISGRSRLIKDIPSALTNEVAHTRYVVDEGYLSSYTLPMHSHGAFLGVIFFDARVRDAFSTELRRELDLYAQVITAAVAVDLAAARSLAGAIHMARDITELRDVETGVHLERVARYSRLVAHNLVEELDLTDEFVEAVYLFAPLHDVGKIGIPDAILLKPGKLDPDEWTVMKTHTTKGRALIDTISDDLGIVSVAQGTVMRNIVEFHHEALDGSGYPRGLHGDEIPLEARMVAVADIFDALTTVRPYKHAWPVGDAMDELARMANAGKLDPRAVSAMLAHRTEAEEILERSREREAGRA